MIIGHSPILAKFRLFRVKETTTLYPELICLDAISVKGRRLKTQMRPGTSWAGYKLAAVVSLRSVSALFPVQGLTGRSTLDVERSRSQDFLVEAYPRTEDWMLLPCLAKSLNGFF